MLLLSVALYSGTGYSWWWFPVLILTPDISMFGYLVDPRTGAVLYNFFHHRGIAVLVYLIGFYFTNTLIQIIGIIIFAHSSMDRLFGYGLKYGDSFRRTHRERSEDNTVLSSR